MCDVNNNYSFTLIDMPCKIRALVLQYKGWNYILCNSKMLKEHQIRSYLHEVLHLKLNHFDNYDVTLRLKNEKEVETVLKLFGEEDIYKFLSENS